MAGEQLERQVSIVSYEGKDYDVVKEGLAEILNLRNVEKSIEEKDNGKVGSEIEVGPAEEEGNGAVKNRQQEKSIEERGSRETPFTPQEKPVEQRNFNGDSEPKPQTVFYNPIQQFNRDLSVLVIRAFGEDLAVVRKAKHQRKGQESAKDGKRQSQGTKRKRDDTEGAGDAERTLDPGARTDVRSSTLNGGKDAGNGISSREKSNDERPHQEDSSTQTIGPEPAVSGSPSLVCNPDPQKSLDYTGVPKGPRGCLQDSVQEDTAPQAPKSHDQKDVRPQTPPFRILDALSATGLRALRYAKEIPCVTSVTANDLSPSATNSIKLNIRHNQLEEKIHATTGDALAHMYGVISNNNKSKLPAGSNEKYEVIDLDPYGTSAPFFDAAVQALVNGGLLCVTCTDAGVFASIGYLEKTFAQYGGTPFKGPQSHEAGLRLILHAIATSAARYGHAIEPLLSLSIDFYARVFVRIHRSPAEVKFLAGKTMLVYNCDQGCGAWTTQHLAQTRAKKDRKEATIYRFGLAQGPSASPNCEHCGYKTHLSGPMWGGPLHNPLFIQYILDQLPSLNKETYTTIPRMEGMLSTALHETIIDASSNTPCNPSESKGQSKLAIPPLNPAYPDKHPFFLMPSALAKVLHCVGPSDAQLRGAFLSLGYQVTRSHTKPGSIRTNAPWTVIWEVMREWVRQKAPVKKNAIKKGTAGWGIMQKDRSKVGVQTLKEKLAAIMSTVDDMQTAQTEIEAALYRASKTTDGALNSEETSPATERTEEDKCEDPDVSSGRFSALEISKLNVVFDEKLGKEREAKRGVRYQMNPRANWGPMNRARGGEA